MNPSSVKNRFERDTAIIRVIAKYLNCHPADVHDTLAHSTIGPIQVQIVKSGVKVFIDNSFFDFRHEEHIDVMDINENFESWFTENFKKAVDNCEQQVKLLFSSIPSDEQ